jgi:hypothetical protein
MGKIFKAWSILAPGQGLWAQGRATSEDFRINPPAPATSTGPNCGSAESHQQLHPLHLLLHQDALERAPGVPAKTPSGPVACRSSASVLTLRRTPPQSDLCTHSGEMIFSTTG